MQLNCICLLHANTVGGTTDSHSSYLIYDFNSPLNQTYNRTLNNVRLRE